MNKPKSLCTSRRRVEREEGSAYIVTLMVLFVLTALGLSLTLITSTESTLGAQERTIQRTFYAADSGLGLALSALMSRSDCESRCVFYESNADDEYSPEDLLDQIEVSKMAALDDRPTALGQINDSDFRNINHYVAARATRITEDPDNPAPLGQRTVAQMFALDPWVAPGGCYVDVFVSCRRTSGSGIISAEDVVSALDELPPP